MEDIVKGNFFDRVLEVLKNARKQAKMALNISMVYSYFEVGRMIVEEQNGKQRAEFLQKTLFLNSQLNILTTL